jgi:hypothetical protein
LTIGSTIPSNQGFIPSFHIAKVNEKFFLQQIQKVYDGLELVEQNNECVGCTWRLWDLK